jgi:hypothetical protein
MNLWPAIVAQLNNENEEIRKGVAWVCGTAVQNNPKAQKAVSKRQSTLCTMLAGIMKGGLHIKHKVTLAFG